jgi:Xaa-Pro dipeptidase
MRKTLELPRFSLKERERRWAEIRKLMKKHDLDGLLICGAPSKWDFTVANARFISQIGGNSTYTFVVFPLEGEPTCYIESSADCILDYFARAQDWVKDIRLKKGQGPWADVLVSRLKELGLEKKNIGADGLAGPLDANGWFPYSIYNRILELMPEANFVNTNDMLERFRAIKSSEEIEFLEKAARLGDLMLETCSRVARPGVRESEVYGKMKETMITNGGEDPTLFLWASDAYPLAHPFRLPTIRPLERGDLIIFEIHPKYGGYFTHVERTFCLGQPDKEYINIYEGCLETYARGMEMFTPRRKISEAMNAVKDTVQSRGLGICECGIHGHGLSSLEYPRYRHHALQTDTKAIDSIENEFKPGMVFAFNIDLVNPRWRNGETGCVFAETVIITEDKPRRLHRFPMNFQIIDT